MLSPERTSKQRGECKETDCSFGLGGLEVCQVEQQSGELS